MKTEQSETNISKDIDNRSLLLKGTFRPTSFTTISLTNRNSLQKSKSILQEFENEAALMKKKQVKHQNKVNKNQNEDFIFRLKLKMITLLKMLELQSRSFVDVQKQSAVDLLQLLGKKIRQFSKDFNNRIKLTEKLKKTLQIRIIELQTQIKFFQTSVETVTKKNQRLIKQAKTESEKVLKKIQEFEQAKSQLCKEQQKNRQILEAQNQYAKNLQEKNKALDKKRQSAESKIKKLEQQMNTMRKKHSEENKKIEDHCELLKDSLMRSSKTINSQTRQIEELNQKILDKQKTIKRLRVEMEQLKKENMENIQKYEAQKKKCKQNNQSINLLQAKLNYYEQKLKVNKDQLVKLLNKFEEKSLYLEKVRQKLISYSENEVQVERMFQKMQMLEQHTKKLQVQNQKQIKLIQENWKIRNEESIFKNNAQWNKKLFDIRQRYEAELRTVDKF